MGEQQPGAGKGFDLWFLFDPKHTRADIDFIRDAGLVVNCETFQLGCTPIINLFPQTSEPIRLDHRRTEYPLIADSRRESSTEIYAVQKVVAVSAGGTEMKPVAQFYGLNHSMVRTNQKAYWYARRYHSIRQNLPGTEVSLTFVDLEFNPRLPDAQSIYAETLCTNRQLAGQLPPGTALQIEWPAPVYRITCLDKPTAQVTPPLHGATLWRLVSQLSLNHLSLDETRQFGIDRSQQRALEGNNLSDELRQRFAHQGIFLSANIVVSSREIRQQKPGWLITDQETGKVYTVTADDEQLTVYTGQEALTALREMLALYSGSAPASTYDMLMGIAALTCRRIVRRLGPDAPWSGLARGLEITITLDDDYYPGHEGILLAAVLNRFFTLYASVNLFTQLVVKNAEHEGVWKQWPPMAGTRPIL
ncbi:MAG: hypothetical protein HGA19_12320 [Oscillochloris sp.]|nr:hypothetical protein [Oscillochloris sp.]